MSEQNPKISPYTFPGIKSEFLPKNLFIKQKKLNYKMTQDSILEIVAEECGVSVDDILSTSRKRENVDARYIYFAAIKLKFRVTLKKMGEDIGNRDHTTVMHGLRMFNQRYVTEEGYKVISDRIMDKLGIEYDGRKVY
jgi:chromosomal replication initiator protein